MSIGKHGFGVPLVGLGGGRFFDFVPDDEAGTAMKTHRSKRFPKTKVDARVAAPRVHSPELVTETIPRLQAHAIQLPINATKAPDFESEVLPLANSKGTAIMAMKTCGHGFFTKGALAAGSDSRSKPDKNPELHRFATHHHRSDGIEFRKLSAAQPLLPGTPRRAA